MRKLYITIFIAAILFCLLFNTGCKKSGSAVEYTLYVTLYEGVSGTPDTGLYTHEENETISYSYSLKEGYSGLKVTFDGTEVPASGTITMDDDHNIEVFTSQGSGDYRITVTVGTGVEGTPAAGFYYHNTGDLINYSYNLKSGYTNLQVFLDGVEVGNTGTITVSKAHTLQSTSAKEYYIQGAWTLNEEYEDGSKFTVVVTFDGVTRTGTVIDSDGGVGTYTVDAKYVNFTLQYPQVRYVYTGNFTEDTNMTGTAKRYISENIYKTGTWTADKNTTTTYGSLSSTKSKGNK